MKLLLGYYLALMVDTQGAGLRDHGAPFSTVSMVFAGLFAVVLLLVVAVTLRMALVAWRRWQSGPTWLFWTLCRAHHLGWGDRWLLWRLVRATELADPARLFVEPGRFEASALPGAVRSQAARLSKIALELFQEPPPAPGVAGAGLVADAVNASSLSTAMPMVLDLDPLDQNMGIGVGE